MATLTPLSPTRTGVVATPITPGSDSIPCGSYRAVILVVRSVSTGTPTITVDDPTSVSPDGATQFDPDVSMTLTAGQLKLFKLDTSRFRNSAGNITYTTATPGDAVVYAIGVA